MPNTILNFTIGGKFSVNKIRTSSTLRNSFFSVSMTESKV